MSDAADSTSVSPFSRRTFDLMRRGPFGRYAVGETISMTGTWMQTMAQSWVMTGLTQKAVMLGLVNFTGAIPMLALTMYGGTVADKLDKRKILVVTNVVQIILAVAIGWLVMTGRIQIWHILTASVLLGISAAFEMPSSSAFVPELVDREHIVTAVAVDRAIFHGTRLVGPALAGWLISRLGHAYGPQLGQASAFYLNALSFLAMIAAIASIRPRAKGTAEEEHQRSTGGMKAGIDYVKQDRPTMAMLGLMASNSLCIFPFMAVMMPLYARDTLHLDANHTGLLMGVSGIGSLVASVGMLSVPRHRRLPMMIAGTVDIALALTGLAFARVFWQAAAALAALAVGTSFNYAVANTTVQERAPGPLRGRVSALAMMSFVGVMPFSSLLVTTLSDFTSIRVSMVAAALVYAAVSLLIFAGPGRGCSELPREQTAAVPMEVEA